MPYYKYLKDYGGAKVGDVIEMDARDAAKLVQYELAVEVPGTPSGVFWSKRIVAKYLAVSENTVLNYSKRGLLPQPIRMSKRKMSWRASDIIEFHNKPVTSPRVNVPANPFEASVIIAGGELCPGNSVVVSPRNS